MICGPCVFEVHIIIKILNNILDKKTLNEIMMLLIYNDYKMKECILSAYYYEPIVNI